MLHVPSLLASWFPASAFLHLVNACPASMYMPSARIVEALLLQVNAFRSFVLHLPSLFASWSVTSASFPFLRSAISALSSRTVVGLPPRVRYTLFPTLPTTCSLSLSSCRDRPASTAVPPLLPLPTYRRLLLVRDIFGRHVLVILLIIIVIFVADVTLAIAILTIVVLFVLLVVVIILVILCTRVGAAESRRRKVSKKAPWVVAI